MSRSKTDILKELLFEIDKICKENDLTYTLTDEIVQHIVEEERLPDEINHLSIARTIVYI